MEKKSPVTPPGIDPRTVRLVAQCLDQYATPGPGMLFRVIYLYLNDFCFIITAIKYRVVKNQFEIYRIYL